MPALTYVYQLKNGRCAGLYRSSQSKVGVSSSRCPEDELMLKLIGDPKLDPKGMSCLNLDSGMQTGVNCRIYDARSKIAAFGNKLAGKGSEL